MAQKLAPPYGEFNNMKQQNFETGQGHEALDPAMWEAGNFGDDMNNFDFLNEIEWSGRPWMDLGGA
jgi:hypothetical protein